MNRQNSPPNKSLETDVCSAGCACSTNAAQLRRSAVSRLTQQEVFYGDQQGTKKP